MLNEEILKRKLESLDGKDYGGYQSLRGEYDFSTYKLIIHQMHNPEQNCHHSA